MKKSVLLLVALLLGSVAALPVFSQGFGSTLAISGSDVIVGETGSEAFSGTVYIFTKSDDGSWAETRQLEAPGGPERGDGYGRAVASNGWQLIVGAPSSNMAYIYTRNDDGSWDAGTALSAPDVVDGDDFGSVVAIGDGFAVVSSTAQNENAGTVYVFRWADGAWTQDAKLAPEPLAADAVFGSSIAVSDDLILIGAPARSGGRGQEYTEVGAVYAFRYADGAWTEVGQLSPQDVTEGGAFGASIALDGDEVAVGAPFDSNSSGSVSLFSWDEESSAYAWTNKLSPFVSSRGTRFGASVGLSEGMVYVGSPGDSRGLGTLYVFTPDGDGGFSSASKSGSSFVSGRAAYGASMAGSESIALVGATGVDSRAGAVVVWEANQDGEWSETALIVNEQKSFAAITDGEVRCENDAAADFECSNVDILSFLPLKEMGGSRGSMTNDIWGWSDDETGREFAIVGRSDGTSFVDVTSPSSPIYLGNLPMTDGATSSVWRDMKVYRNHVFIVADGAGQHGMQVFDLARLRDMDGSDPGILDVDFLYDNVASVHNIVINETTGFAYAVGSSSGGVTCGGGLHMIDIREPKNPTFAGCFADESTGRRGTGYTHDAQCVTYAGPDTEHAGKEICMGSNETALSISDVTDKENPVAIAMIVYPNVAYAHQGWLSEDHEYFYMNDEGDEPQGLVDGTRTLVWDVRDLDEPVLVTEYIATTTTTDHNLYIKGNLMYQSNYGSGLRILDISDRANPVEVGFLDTTPFGGGGSWSNYPYFKNGAIAVTSMGEGLFMVRKQDQGL